MLKAIYTQEQETETINKKLKEEKIITKYKYKENVKKLTTEERLTRIEEMLNI